MNNDETKLKSKWADRIARHNAAFDKVVSVRNTAILFWTAFALYLLYTSYVPPGMIENRWVIILARSLFLATISLWIIADGRTQNIEKQWLGTYSMGSIMFPLVVISLPIYMIHSRGWLGAAKSTVRFAGYLLLALVIWIALVGILAIFGIHEVGKPTMTF